MPIRLERALDFNAQALSLRARRQSVLAANIANADTPNYKAVDFEMRRALQDAGVLGRPDLPMTRTQGDHLHGRQGPGLPTALLYRTPHQASLDGNTVEMDAERANFAENSLRYEASLRFLNGQIRTLQSAIAGQ